MESLQIIKRIIRCADYHGPVNKCCGATGGQKEALAQEQKVSQLLTTNFQDFAGENKNILEHLVQSLSPISSAGPSQFGLAPAAEAAERTTTAEQLSAAGQNAANAVRSTLASRGGGTTYLPSGSEASIIGSLAQDTATKEALTQADITKQGCDIGRQNWLAATQELAAAPGALEAPVTGAGGAAIGAAGQAMQGATDIAQANQAWMAPVGGIIGAVAQGATMGAAGGGSKRSSGGGTTGTGGR